MKEEAKCQHCDDILCNNAYEKVYIWTSNSIKKLYKYIQHIQYCMYTYIYIKYIYN